MITGMLNIVLVLLVLVGMVMLLLGISHFFCRGIRGYDDSDSDRMRHRIDDDFRVITRESLFSEFLLGSIGRRKRVRRHHSSRKPKEMHAP